MDHIMSSVRIIAAVASIAAAGCTNASTPTNVRVEIETKAGRILSIGELLERSAELKGQRVTVHGYFVFEPENRNLWTGAEAYGEQEEPCVSLEMTDEIYNKRETYNRRDLDVSGLVTNTGCDDNQCTGRCNDVGLSNISIVGFGKPLSALSPIPVKLGDISLSINGQAPDASSLRKFGERFATILRAGCEHATHRKDILALVPRRHRKIVERALGAPESRLNWLLFSGDQALGRSLEKDNSIRLDVAKAERVSSRIEPAGYLCYCIQGHCSPGTLTSVRVYYRAAADPYFCIPTNREGNDWWLDAGYLVGRPAEDRMR